MSQENKQNQIKVHTEIVTVGNPILREKAKAVDNTEEARGVCDRLVRVLRELKGAGLAAPQIGESIRAFVVEIHKSERFPDRDESPLYVMINPEIVESSDDQEDGWEGCFSIPGFMGNVPRNKRIKMRFTTPDGAEHEEVFENYLARVMQHEYDHLDGITYLDKINSVKELTTTENWLKLNNK